MSASQRGSGRPILPMKRQAPTDTGGAAILLIEEYSVLGELVAGYLRDEGCRVSVAAGLAEAEAYLLDARFDLVLTDPFRLGTTELGTDRWTSLRRIRDLAGATPIVICSPYSPADFGDYRARGFADLLRKPYSAADLLATVRRNLGLGEGAVVHSTTERLRTP
jgi:CheY-like chemotaxis protein